MDVDERKRSWQAGGDNHLTAEMYVLRRANVRRNSVRMVWEEGWGDGLESEEIQ